MATLKTFTLREADVCVKCATLMPVGTEVSWLRDPEAKGFFHVSCGHLPAQPGLVLRKRPDPTNVLGFVWARAGSATTMPPRTQPKALMALPDTNTQSTALTVSQAPAAGVIEALAQAIMPYLTAHVTAQVNAELSKVTVRVHREGM